MVFSTSIFLFFFLPLVIAGYYLVKENYRIGFLLVASLFFYAWGEPKYILVMLFSIALNYIFGVLIYRSTNNNVISRILLFIAIVLNLAILFYFKYYNFFIESSNMIFFTGFNTRNIILPVGISFYLFQGMSYLIDLYWKKIDLQKNPVKLAFYISFFPQLMAGPIIRYSDIKEEIDSRNESMGSFISGIQKFVIGLSKKAIIANSMGEVSDIIFGTAPSDLTTGAAWLGTICYSFQIYFDFSGYSCMAIGLARMFGFNFKENFNYPYISKSMTEFWTRWNISLGLWFRDYVYIPIGGNRKGNVYFNTFILFFIVGLWHGASFNCILWGVYFGVILIVERLLKVRDVKNKLLIPLRHLIFIFLYLMSVPIFRAPNISHSIEYFNVLFGISDREISIFPLIFFVSPRLIIMLIIAAFASTPVLTHISNFLKNKNMLVAKHISYLATFVLLLFSLLFVIGSSYNPFIYFRF